jgi:hypothetical protein
MQPGDSVRASSLGYMCPREEVLAYKYDVIRGDHKDPSLQITLDIGNVFHDLYRNIYYGPMQDWAGAWRCVRCGWDTDKAGLSEAPVFTDHLVSPGKIAKMPPECGGCGAPFWTHPDDGEIAYGDFKEWFVKDHSLLIHGHPDGWMWIPAMKRVLVDLKSHGKRGFDNRKKLRDGHDHQVMAYGHLCGDQLGAVMYMNKSPWGDHQSFVKPIPVKTDKKIFKKEIVEPLGILQNGLAGGPMPERVCLSADCPKARECQLADVCFN